MGGHAPPTQTTSSPPAVGVIRIVLWLPSTVSPAADVTRMWPFAGTVQVGPVPPRRSGKPLLVPGAIFTSAGPAENEILLTSANDVAPALLAVALVRSVRSIVTGVVPVSAMTAAAFLAKPSVARFIPNRSIRMVLPPATAASAHDASMVLTPLRANDRRSDEAGLCAAHAGDVGGHYVSVPLRLSMGGESCSGRGKEQRRSGCVTSGPARPPRWTCPRLAGRSDESIKGRVGDENTISNPGRPETPIGQAALDCRLRKATVFRGLAHGGNGRLSQSFRGTIARGDGAH